MAVHNSRYYGNSGKVPVVNNKNFVGIITHRDILVADSKSMD